MQDYIEARVLKTANYIIETGATVRAAAYIFSVGKSTVHKDMTERLFETDRDLFYKVELILQKNKAERHIRGGLATKRRYGKC
ncbi:MAG: sporulation transcriptional regulator SpoIIID [Clostridia bacterium]